MAWGLQDRNPDSVDVDDIKAIEVEESAISEARAIQERSDYDTLKKETELTGLRQDIQERKRYANKIYVLVCVWLGLMLLMLFLDGWNGMCPLCPWICVLDFKLDNAVMIALISGTTINVLGLFAIVANYLFSKAK